MIDFKLFWGFGDRQTDGRTEIGVELLLRLIVIKKGSLKISRSTTSKQIQKLFQKFNFLSQISLKFASYETFNIYKDEKFKKTTIYL